MKQFSWILAPLLLGAQVTGVEVTTPALGYVLDESGGAVRPIEGVPGAAALGGRVNLNGSIQSLWVSPNRRHALAAGEESGLLSLKLNGAVGVAHALSPERPLAAAFSPDGATAAVWTGGHLEVWRGLPDAPSRTQQWAAPEGGISHLAVSDDGSLAAYVSSGRLFQAGSEPRAVDNADGYSAICFLRNSHTLIAANPQSHQILVWNKLGSGAGPEPLASSEGVEAPASLALSADESQVAVLGAGRVWLLDRFGGAHRSFDASETGAQGVWKADGNAVFQLHRTTGAQGVWLLDGDSAEPRLVPVFGGAQ